MPHCGQLGISSSLNAFRIPLEPLVLLLDASRCRCCCCCWWCCNGKRKAKETEIFYQLFNKFRNKMRQIVHAPGERCPFYIAINRQEYIYIYIYSKVPLGAPPSIYFNCCLATSFTLSLSLPSCFFRHFSLHFQFGSPFACFSYLLELLLTAFASSD